MPRNLRDRAFDVLQRRVDTELDTDVFQRDTAFIRDHLPTIGRAVGTYFGAEVRGLHRLPEDGPFLLVSNHSGGWLMPDAWALFDALLSRFGADREMYGLMLELAFAIPGFGDALRRIGAVPATMANAERALELGAGVVIYPGGAWEVYRPWHERNRVDFHGHRGFIRLALRHGVPVFPTVSHGSQHSLVVVSRGERMASLVGADRFHVRVFPFAVGFPFGLTSAFMPNVPLPSKIVVEVLDPLDWSSLGADAADDPGQVRACYDDITGRMQAALDRLVAETPHPLFARLRG